jgi:hypothetical protein
MKEINVETYGVPAEGRSKNYRGKTVTASVSGGSASAASPQGGSASTANMANTANVALNLSSDSTDWEKILRKDEEDSTSYAIDFLKGLKIASVLISSVLASSSTGAASDDSIFTSKAVQAKIEDAIKALSDIYLSKIDDDSAAGLITFLKGLKLGSNGMGIDENGNAILDSISKLCSLVSSKFSLNSEGGFKFWEQDGHSYGQIDYLTVMVKQMVKSLSILHIDFISGSLAVNRAGNEITRVEMVDSAGAVVTAVASAYAYRCYFTIKDNTTTNKNRWVIGDMVRCQTFSVETGAQYLSGYDKFYWRLAVGLGVVGDEGYVDLSVSSCADKSDAPAAGDKMIQYGWMDTDLSDGVTHPERQGLIMLDIDNLAIVIYEGIGTNGWSTTGCDKNVFSPFGTKVDASQISIRTGSGVSVRQPCDRGAWATGTTAYFYDRFSYGGDLWLCIDGSSAGTTSEPSASSASWQRQTATAAVDVASAFQLLTDADSIVIDTDASGLAARIISAPTRFWGLYGTTVLGGGALYQVAYVENAATYGTDKFRRVTVKDFDELSVLIDSLTNIKISGTSDTDGCHLTFTVSDTSVACVGGWFRIHADMTSSDGKSASLDRVIPVIVNKTGSAGLNAVNISLSPSSVILTQTYNSTTHASAIDYSGATTTVMGTYGAMSIPAAISSITASGCTAAYDGNKVTVSAVSDGVISAYVDITTTAGGVTQVLRFVIYVNYLGTWWSETYNDFNGRYASKTMVNKDGDTVNVTDLLSSVEQQANSISESVSEVNKQVGTNTQDIAALTITSKNISLKVAETQTGRHNLLSGSAFRRREEFTYNNEAVFPDLSSPSCSIQKNAGYHGTNAIYINITEDTQRFIGLRWEGISIIPGTTYMFSVLVKSPDITTFTQGANIELRVNPSGANKGFYTSIVPSKSGAWEQITWAFTVPDTVLNETTSKNEVPTSVTVAMYIVAAGKLYLCRPMMEQSDTFTGWSLSEKDFDYVGGNILPNSRLLTDLTGNNLAPNIQWSPTKVDNGYGDCTTLYEGVNDTTSYNRNILQWTNNISLKKNTDYMFSMWAKGTGYVQMLLYCFTDSTNNPIAFVESSDGYIGSGNDGFVWFKLTSEYRRIWVHYRTNNTFDETVKMTFIAVRQQYDSTSELAYLMSQENTITVASPKLETGATVTNYSESGEDMVSKKALLATGIDVTNGKITATSDNFYIQNNSGQLSAAVDEKGNLSAGSLSTLHESGSPYVYIKDGEMKVFGNTAMNIRFGVNSDGMAVLQYYDNSGKLLYDLGPNGWSTSRISTSNWEEIKVVSITTIGYTESTIPANGATVDSTDAYKLFSINSNYSVTTLYKYHAGKLNGAVVKDDTYGFSIEQATAADGHVFTAKNINNLCTGTYTYNNESHMLMNTDGLYAKKFVWFSAGSMSSGTWYCTKANYNIVNGLVAN